MTEAVLYDWLGRRAQYWIGRYRWTGDLLEAGDLVSYGWIAWNRARTKQRAEGAMRDRLITLSSQLGRVRVLSQREVNQVAALPPRIERTEPRRAPSVRMIRTPSPSTPHDYDRTRRILEARAAGQTWQAIGRELGLEGSRVSALHKRALRRVEAARIQARLRGRRREV